MTEKKYIILDQFGNKVPKDVEEGIKKILKKEEEDINKSYTIKDTDYKILYINFSKLSNEELFTKKYIKMVKMDIKKLEIEYSKLTSSMDKLYNVNLDELSNEYIDLYTIFIFHFKYYMNLVKKLLKIIKDIEFNIKKIYRENNTSVEANNLKLNICTLQKIGIIREADMDIKKKDFLSVLKIINKE